MVIFICRVKSMILFSILRRWEAVSSSIVCCGQTFLRVQPEELEFWVFCWVGGKGGDQCGIGLELVYIIRIVGFDV